jgi:hypothetical protein
MDIPSPSQKYNLQRLQYWLEFELSASTLMLFSFFWGLLMGLAFIAAIIFIPFMIKVLYEERKWGWIISFIVIILLPGIIIYLINIPTGTKMLLSYIPLAFFFLYCFTLRMTVRDWLTNVPL